MKTFTISVLLCFHLLSFAADTLKLSTTKFYPRVGDDVQFHLSTAFLDTMIKDEITNSLPASSTFTTDKIILPAHFYTFRLTFSDTGKHVIGPFHFTVNGKAYITDSVVLYVQKKLPDTAGLWMRTVTFNGKNYLIIEQLYDENNSPVVEAKEYPAPGVYLKNVSSNYSGRNSSGLNYHSVAYEVSVSRQNSPFLPMRNHFTNLPGNFQIPRLQFP
ncbi:MAG: hypothetical protein GC181_12175 [Bacteroidetes bacterium]|nr:hypothetical protein [Bacteroidota bacterium]